MDYLDFELHIGAGSGITYPVTVIRAAAGGEPSIIATLPVNDAAIRQQMAALVATRSAQVTVHRGDIRLHQSLPTLPHHNEPAIARAIGQQLFQALITGTVRDAYSSSLVKAREQGRGLRLRLRIEAPSVAALPWEFLYDPQEGDHICLLRETPLTRYTALPRDQDRFAVKPPLRVLGMVANPTDLVAIDVAQEKARIEQALEYRLERGDVELQWTSGGTWPDLQRMLDRGPWHVFHFIGHGAFDPTLHEGVLHFCNEQGVGQPMPATALGRLFSGHPALRLVFLNACEGGRTTDANLFASVGAVLTRRGIPAIISMQFDITDRAALEFARLFYDALARGNPVDVAVTAARTGLSLAAPESIEWATPMLHMRAPDGQLFVLDASAAIFDQSKPVSQSAKAVTPSTPPNVTPSPVTNQPTPRGLIILRRYVKQYWIDGVLTHSLFQQTFYDLGLELRPDAVQSPWGTQIERPGEPSRALGQGQSIVTVFDEHGGSLLILGEPGSGKSTTLLDLTRILLQRGLPNDESRQPAALPVVFSLSAWSPDFPLLEEYLAAQMSLQYQIPRVEGRNLLAAGRILPMLDGLDETDSKLRTACVEAINSYILNRSLTGLVVCCRLKEYVDLPVRLALNTAVRLTEMSDEQVDSYLAVAGDLLAGLRALLRRETAMRFDARSPLWLNLLARAYQGLSTIDLAQEDERGSKARHRQMMEAYRTRMFRRARGEAT